MRMSSEIKKLLNQHQNLNHSEDMKVVSHVQREEGEWFQNTIMIDGYDIAFKYKRKKTYKNLTGQRVNITYYPTIQSVAGFDIEIMNIVRIKVA